MAGIFCAGLGGVRRLIPFRLLEGKKVFDDWHDSYINLEIRRLWVALPRLAAVNICGRWSRSGSCLIGSNQALGMRKDRGKVFDSC